MTKMPLIVRHTPSPHTHEMFEAVVSGATDPEIESVDVVRRAALAVSPTDMLEGALGLADRAVNDFQLLYGLPWVSWIWCRPCRGFQPLHGSGAERSRGWQHCERSASRVSVGRSALPRSADVPQDPSSAAHVADSTPSPRRVVLGYCSFRRPTAQFLTSPRCKPSSRGSSTVGPGDALLMLSVLAKASVDRIVGPLDGGSPCRGCSSFTTRRRRTHRKCSRRWCRGQRIPRSKAWRSYVGRR